MIFFNGVDDNMTMKNPILRQAREARELLTSRSPKGLRLTQITTDPKQASANIYSESPVFTPDSRRFIFQRLDVSDPTLRASRRTYCLCDLADRFALYPLTDEEFPIAPAMSPDGKWFYYFVHPLAAGKAGTTLKRVSLESFQRETLFVFDRPLAGTGACPGIIYVLSTISSDGQRLAFGAFFGDGQQAGAPWGLVVFDLQKGTAAVIVAGSDYNNLHPQYSRSKDAKASHDIMFQHNHGSFTDASGRSVRLGGGDPLGADLHVIRDDGSDWRDLPCGRDPREKCHGHEAWRGEMETICVGVDIDKNEGSFYRPVLEVKPLRVPEEKRHGGKKHLEGWRNEITRGMNRPKFAHLALDPSGTRFIGDYLPPDKQYGQEELWIGRLPPEPNACLQPSYLLDLRTSDKFGQASHAHAFFSPDGRRAFFNSDFTGLPQLWMVEGFE